jgi:hypothetical protein
MSEALSESAIVSAVAEAAAERITRKVIADLQRLKDTLSAADSGLETAWDEICVQAHDGESFYWDAYNQTVQTLVGNYVTKLPTHEREALWLQTQAGVDWDFKEPEDREPYPVFDDEIVDYVVSEYVYARAGEWSNARIRAYLDRSSGEMDI